MNFVRLPPHARTVVWLAAAIGICASCADAVETIPGRQNGSASESDFFRDVTETNLPSGVLDGLSMDARIADVDGDGDLDIVIANEFAPNILLINDGSGNFANQSSNLPAANRDSEDVGIADFDEDGDLDVIIVSEDDQINEFYLNDGLGTFVDAGNRIPVTGISNAVLVADIDGDGSPDILIGNNGQNVVLINDGDANFADETAQRLPALSDVTQDVELGDVDGDGDLDLLVGNEDRNRLLINDGSGMFLDESDLRIPLRTAPEETREADFGDVDNDGDLDIHFANVNAFVAGADPANRLLINDGDGFFSDETATRLPSNSDRSFEGDFVDIDADGDLDIITGNSNGSTSSPYRVYLNGGGGVFADGTADLLPASALGSGFDVEAGDFNADGLLDLFLVSRGSADRLLLGR